MTSTHKFTLKIRKCSRADAQHKDACLDVQIGIAKQILRQQDKTITAAYVKLLAEGISVGYVHSKKAFIVTTIDEEISDIGLSPTDYAYSHVQAPTAPRYEIVTRNGTKYELEWAELTTDDTATGPRKTIYTLIVSPKQGTTESNFIGENEAKYREKIVEVVAEAAAKLNFRVTKANRGTNQLNQPINTIYIDLDFIDPMRGLVFAESREWMGLVNITMPDTGNVIRTSFKPFETDQGKMDVAKYVGICPKCGIESRMRENCSCAKSGVKRSRAGSSADDALHSMLMLN